MQIPVKIVLALCMALAAATLAGGCGSERVAVVTHDEDGDIDSRGQGGPDVDNDAIYHWAAVADPADARAVAALLRRYYAVAIKGDAATACTMIDRIVIDRLEEGSEEETRRAPNWAPRSASEACQRTMSATFAKRHRELVKDVTAFRVETVQQRGNHAVALIVSGPERILQVSVRREHGIWRMDTPLFTAQ
ncbi:MAG TPA: hypothetical protein VHU13_03435 [Solirubrobacteraceae bacterium]|nr:hypothetical protein [Solirubrobacteraceae bacterium]